MFKSDFRIVADYFVQMRKNSDYIPTKEQFEHVDALLKLMSVLTGDSRFEDAQNIKEGGGQSMCEVFDQYEEKGRREGKIEGKIEAYLDAGFSLYDISSKLNMSEEAVEEIILNLRKTNS